MANRDCNWRIRQCFHPRLQLWILRFLGLKQTSSQCHLLLASARIPLRHPLRPALYFLPFQNTTGGSPLLGSASKWNPCILDKYQVSQQLSERTSSLKLDKIENISLCCYSRTSKKGLRELHFHSLVDLLTLSFARRWFMEPPFFDYPLVVWLKKRGLTILELNWYERLGGRKKINWQFFVKPSYPPHNYITGHFKSLIERRWLRYV